MLIRSRSKADWAAMPFYRTRLTLFIGIVCALIASAIAGRGDGLYVPFNFPATSCTNQFIRSLAAATGAGTCNSVAIGSDVSGLGTNIATFLAANLTVSGALKVSSGTPSQAVCADLSNAGTACSSPILQSKLLTITRVLSTADGNVSYTGMGFQPTACFAFGEVAGSLTQYVNVIGMTDSARTAAGLALGASVLSTSTNFLVFKDATVNVALANISSYDADGFTLTWAHGNSPTGTATIYVMCFR